MDSVNAILLTPPKTFDSPYKYDDYGVKPAHCIPNEVPPFEYSGLSGFGLDGKEAPSAEVEEMRKMAELYHRIKLEL